MCNQVATMKRKNRKENIAEINNFIEIRKKETVKK